jgi:hypothetical protein
MFPAQATITVANSQVCARKPRQPSRRSASSDDRGGGTCAGDEDAGRDRPRDRADRHGDGPQRVGPLERLRGHDRGEQADAGRREERRRGPAERGQRAEHPHLGDAGDEQDRHRALAHQPHRVAGDHQRPPRQPVGDHAADEQEDDERERPRRQHEAEVRRRVREVQDRERERDADHPVAEQRRRLAEEQAPEVAVPQDVEPHVSRPGRGGRRGRRG